MRATLVIGKRELSPVKKPSSFSRALCGWPQAAASLSSCPAVVSIELLQGDDVRLLRRDPLQPRSLTLGLLAEAIPYVVAEQAQGGARRASERITLWGGALGHPFLLLRPWRKFRLCFHARRAAPLGLPRVGLRFEDRGVAVAFLQLEELLADVIDEFLFLGLAVEVF